MHPRHLPRRLWRLGLALALGAVLLVGIAGGGGSLPLQLLGHAPSPTRHPPLHAPPSALHAVPPGAAQVPHAPAPGAPLPVGAAASTALPQATHPPPVVAPTAMAGPAAGPRLPPSATVVIQRVATTRPYVALTLDDFYTGNYQRRTAIRQLQAANALHAALTLCPAGSALVAYTKKAPAQAQAIKQLVATGSYEFCDHTYSHPVMPTLGVAAQTQEMLHGAAAIRAFFGRSPIPVFRPPYGSWDASTQRAAAAAGFPRIVTWSVDTGDSEGAELPAERLVANVACARPGDIILMHANRRSSAVALPLIITLLRANGLEPVHLSTLLASGTPVSTTRPSDMRHLYTCGTPRAQRAAFPGPAVLPAPNSHRPGPAIKRSKGRMAP